jgi:uncharacterized protein YydD (DUF2326 family)
MPEKSLLELTRELLDIKAEKKQCNKEYNERIKELESSIKAKAKDGDAA